VALLLEQAKDPRAQDRVGQAVKDANPTTRAIAARVVSAGGLDSLAPRLAAALASETNDVAAREQARALLVVDARADDLVVEAAQRLRSTTAGELGVILAAIRGPAALSKIEALRAAGLPDYQVSSFLEIASRDDPKTLATVGPLAVRNRDSALWSGLLFSARKHEVDMPAGLLAKALGEDDTLRTWTLDHLALTQAGGQPRPEVLARALESLRGAMSGPGRPFALELIDRVDGRPATDRTASLRQAADKTLPFLQQVFESPRAHDLLTASEGDAIRARLGLPEKGGRPREVAGTPAASHTTVRLATGYPPGFITDLLAASGCVPNEHAALGGLLSRDKFGRPTDLGVYGDLAGSPACIAAAQALLATHLNPMTPEAARAGRELLLLPLHPEGLACRQESESIPANPEAVHVGGKITEPKKVRTLAPRYPDSAKNDHVSGVVILQAKVSPIGCVCELEVLGGSDVRLAVAALQAVAGWRYTPTLLGGVPVPVLMTVTVNFKLS
jgi:TonB family protein